MTFWNWFRTNAAELQRAIESDHTASVVNLMNEGATLLPASLGWEVGPHGDGLMLALALNGDLDNLAPANELISDAPELDGWSFHVGRPPKRWDLRFTMPDGDGRAIDFDANTWRYGLVAFDGGRFFDVTVVAPEGGALDEATREQAAILVLQGILGEVRFLEVVDRVVVVDRPPEGLPLTDIQHLAPHLDSLQPAPS